MRYIWVNGCFDILHVGHLNLLEWAKNCCDDDGYFRNNKLIVGIDSDKRVKELKGDTRPINNQRNRKRMLKSLKFVDEVFIFDNEMELTNLIKNLDIDLMVVGDDYKDKKVVGSEFSKEGVFFFPIEIMELSEYSTTNIINKIKRI